MFNKSPLLTAFAYAAATWLVLMLFAVGFALWPLVTGFVFVFLLTVIMYYA